MRALILISLIAGLLPFAMPEQSAIAGSIPFPGWPSDFEGQTIQELPLSDRETSFHKNFPGRVGRFTDGNRQFIIRWITRSSRALHPASDCLKASGYAISARPVQQDRHGNLWGCFQADKDEESLAVCEQIRDIAGNTFSDVSAWFWNAALDKTQGPWWATTVISKKR